MHTSTLGFGFDLISDILFEEIEVATATAGGSEKAWSFFFLALIPSPTSL